jgi:hypothetical protein
VLAERRENGKAGSTNILYAVGDDDGNEKS